MNIEIQYDSEGCPISAVPWTGGEVEDPVWTIYSFAEFLELVKG